MTSEPSIVSVVVGVGECPDADCPLPSAVVDATRMAVMLRQHWRVPEPLSQPPIELIMWPDTDSPPERSPISPADRLLDAIYAAAAAATDTDMFLVYLRGCVEDREGELSFLAGAEGEGGGLSVLPLSDIFDAGTECRSAHRLLILDWPRGPAGDARQVLDVLGRTLLGWTVWLACEPGQHGLDLCDASPPRGLFVDSVVRAVAASAQSMRGTADLPTVFAHTARFMRQAIGDPNVKTRASLPGSPGRPPTPLIAAGPLASDGEFELHLAPRRRDRSPDRIEAPTPRFWRDLPKFARSPAQWPIHVPLVGLLIWLCGLCYALVMTASVPAFRHHPLDASSLMLATGVGVLSLLIWRMACAVLVLANEERWRHGPLCSTALFLAWNVLVMWTVPLRETFIIDVLFFTFVFWLYGIGPISTLITFADHVRAARPGEPDTQRGDPGHLVYIFSGLARRHYQRHERSVFGQWVATPDFYILSWLPVATCLLIEWAVLQRPSHLLGWLALRNAHLAWFAFFQWVWYLCGYLIFHNLVRRR